MFPPQISGYFLPRILPLLRVTLDVILHLLVLNPPCWQPKLLGNVRHSFLLALSTSDLKSQRIPARLSQTPERRQQLLYSGPPQLSDISHYHLCPKSERTHLLLDLIIHRKSPQILFKILLLSWALVR